MPTGCQILLYSLLRDVYKMKPFITLATHFVSSRTTLNNNNNDRMDFLKKTLIATIMAMSAFVVVMGQVSSSESDSDSREPQNIV